MISAHDIRSYACCSGRPYLAAAVLAISIASPTAGGATNRTRADEPETVLITLHAKPGAEADLARLIARHWETARQLHLVADAPHLTFKADEDGDKTYFIDIFTWRDAAIPDAAPAAIQAIWGELHRLVEARDGHQGLEITTIHVVTP
jgi:hypothetical protein